ncbi:MAG TPA: hypothetical protein VJN64_11480, partial [Terriglobales bacterium]|nr:hypothetical protein [Terriglobales bacterium]
MHIKFLVTSVVLLGSCALAQEGQPARASTVITDPAQITAKENFDVQPLSIEKLYMTRSIGDSAWSPDG